MGLLAVEAYDGVNGVLSAGYDEFFLNEKWKRITGANTIALPIRTS
jgi:hypothetical protein